MGHNCGILGPENKKTAGEKRFLRGKQLAVGSNPGGVATFPALRRKNIFQVTTDLRFIQTAVPSDLCDWTGIQSSRAVGSLVL